MQHATQVRILEELLGMVEQGRNCDAGVQVLNPAEAYTSSELAEREWQTFFRQYPQLIGLSGDLPNNGSYLSLNDFGVPVLACRDDQGQFRAFVNACRHRGTRVTDAPRGEASRFVCPFHGWTYGTDGSLRAVTEAEQFGDVRRECNGLLELSALERYGMLWVHPVPGASIDLDVVLGGLAEEIDNWQLGNRVFSGSNRLDKNMNWKLANDTFGETYHFKRLHRRTLNNIFHGDALACEAFDRNHRAVFPTKSILNLRNKPQENWRIDHASTVLYYLFPNIQMTVSERQITMFRIYPDPQHVGKSTTLVNHYFSETALAMLDDDDMTVINDDNVYDPSARDGKAIISPAAAMEIVNSTLELEDYSMAESTQQNVECGLIPHLVFGHNEVPLHHFHNTFRRVLDLTPLERV